MKPHFDAKMEDYDKMIVGPSSVTWCFYRAAMNNFKNTKFK